MNNQHMEPELTVGEIIKLYLSHWKMFAFFTVVLFAISAIVYAIKVPYVASSKIIINDSQNSSMQAFSNQYFGLSKTLQESKKGSSQLSKHIEYLKTREFYETLLGRAITRAQSPKITMEERAGFEELQKNFGSSFAASAPGHIELLQTLDRWTKFNLDSEFELKVVVSTPSRAQSLFLSNTASELATELLKQREMAEISKVEGFMNKQKEDADAKLVDISKQLANMQLAEGALLPLASKDKMGDYVSELLVRSNETKLKIGENNKLIEYLQKGRSGQRESSLYGVGGKIEALKIENSLLNEKLGQINRSIANLKKEVKQLPFEAQMVEDLKKKSEVEFARFKELSNSLAKIEAAKLSIDTRFEVMESARWETTGPQIGLFTLGLLSVLLSQFAGSLLIYFRYLWNPQVVTAEASRNLVILDNHSLDPRVIIENSKIKFSLKKSEKPKDEADEQQQQDEQSKLAWNMLNIGQSTDVSQ